MAQECIELARCKMIMFLGMKIKSKGEGSGITRVML